MNKWVNKLHRLFGNNLLITRILLGYMIFSQGISCLVPQSRMGLFINENGCYTLTLCAAVIFVGSFRWAIVRRNISILMLMLLTATGLLAAYTAWLNENNGISVIAFWATVLTYGCYFDRHRDLLIYLSASGIAICLSGSMADSINLGISLDVFISWTIVNLLLFYIIQSYRIGFKNKLLASEAQLQARTKELDAILDTMPTQLVLKDLNNNVVRVNAAMARFRNKERGEIEGKSLYETLPYEQAKKHHDDDLNLIVKNMTMATSIQNLVDGHGNLRIFHTRNYPLHDNKGQPYAVLIQAEDITDSLKSQEQIKESEELFRLVFEYAPYPMFIADTETARLLRSNRAATELLGYSSEEIAQLSLFGLIHPDDAQRAAQSFRQKIESQAASFSGEKRFSTKQGGTGFANFSFIVVNNKEGKPDFVICVLIDTTEQTQAQITLERYAHQLEQSNRNLEEFAYVASHDLREPLRTIVSYTQLLERRLKKTELFEANPDIPEFMEYVVGGAKRMEALIKAFLEYSRAGRTTDAFELVDMNDAYQAAIDNLHAQIEELGASVEAEKLPQVFGRIEHLTALFQNLINNSLKYNKAELPKVRVVVKATPGGYYTFFVSDNGIGIDAKNAEEIFTVFRRLHTRDQYSGLGIGLAICKKIVAMHGGAIGVDDTPQQGATVYFTLPRV